MEKKYTTETLQSPGKVRIFCTKNISNKISTILAMIGLGISSEVMAENPIQFSAPVNISGPGIEKYNAESGKSRIFVPHNGIRTETISQMTLSISPLQAGPYGGTLTISGVMRVISGEIDAHTGEGLSDMIVMIQQQLFHGSGNEIRRMGDSNEDIFWNDTDPVFDGPDEGVDKNRKFSFTVPVSSKGIQYTMQNYANVGWGDGTVMLAGDIDGNEPLKVEYIPYVTNPDTNNNGIFDDWEMEKFHNIDEGANKPGDDPDNDGMSNLEEYAFGTDPLSYSSSRLRYGIKQRYSYIFGEKNLQAKNIVYIPEVSSDLQNWSSTSPSLHDLSEKDSLDFMDNHGGLSQKRFFRIRIEAR